MANTVTILSSIYDFASTVGNPGDIVAVDDIRTTSGNLFVYLSGASPIEVYDNSNNLIGGIAYKADGGCWVMMYSGDLNIQWFGAIGNGEYNNGADTAAFQKAFDIGVPSIYVPSTPWGYRLDTVEILNLPVTIKGDNLQRTSIFPNKDDISIFRTKVQSVQFYYLNFSGLIRAQNEENPQFKKVNAIELYWSELQPSAGSATISDCFFVNFIDGIGVYNNSVDPINKISTKSGMDSIYNCQFLYCKYGIFSNGGFINSRIYHSYFTECSSAIKIIKSKKPENTTEGVTIEDNMIFGCGSPKDNFDEPAVLSEASFTYVTNCGIDQSKNSALHLINAQYSRITDNWLASDFSDIGKAAVRIEGVCFNIFFNNCNIQNFMGYGIEMVNTLKPSMNVVLSNCCFGISSNSIGKASGFIFIDAVQSVRIQSCNFHDAPLSDPNWNSFYLAVNGENNDTNVLFDTCYITGKIHKDRRDIDCRLINCYNMPTVKTGIILFPQGEATLEFNHDLVVLEGQFVSVLVNNSSSYEAITAGIDSNNINKIKLGRDNVGLKPELAVNYTATVFNNW